MIKKINLERESASPKNKVMLGALLGGKRAEKHKILKEEQVKMRNEEATSLMKGLLALMPSALLTKTTWGCRTTNHKELCGTAHSWLM